MKFKIDNGFLMSVRSYQDWIIIEGATPKSFNIVIDLENRNRYYSSYLMDFQMEGMINDIDGGIPFNLKSISEDGYSYDLVDSPKLIDLRSKKLLNPDGENHGEYMSLNEVLNASKLEDNPIIVVAHIKTN